MPEDLHEHQRAYERVPHEHQRDDEGADWVRWGIGLLLAASITISTGLIAFSFKLSNDVTTLQAHETYAAGERERERNQERDQRSEMLTSIRDLTNKVSELGVAVTVLSQRIQRSDK